MTVNSPNRAVVEPQQVGYDAFPESEAASEGMRVIPADLTPRYARVTTDVRYAQKDGYPLRVHVLHPPVPEDDERTFPLIGFVQGSGWFPQDLGANAAALADFTKRGYVVAIIEYRPSTVAAFPAQIHDTRTALRFLSRNAARFRVDPSRIALWGDSSGGHTTVLTYLTENDQAFSEEPVGEEPLGIRCFVDYYGPTDISRMCEEPSVQNHIAPDSPEGMLIGGRDVRENPELVAPTVAMNHVTPDAALKPLLIMHGSKDRLVPFAQSVLLHDALKAAGQPVTFYKLAGADHGGAPFWQEDVLDIVDAFLKAHL
ncbi:alpha/beta hydrolase [Streptomyces sp. LP11]|uniref:Alpha/beta hydrolase n=1 Tax=Streptomyces pyxinicus TaxID=2970331 RepID=A0ABT2AU85_9ACTN|nr:alpha/beta hydrolase [Streptomyces sp. LP11]MCS0599720.1 alpha/beta hydrolase [Streptomyces sp. LP11]